jgi:peptidoglycan/LPS O-acetylase OafA/YrhL
MGVAGFVFAAAPAIFLFPLAFSGQMFSLALGPALYNSMGNGHWQSAVYALWDSTFAVGLTVGLIVLFRRLFNRESRLGRFLSEQSYAVYIIHIPIVVFGAYLLRSIPLESLPKFGLVSIILIPVCFSVAYLVRKIPFVSRII